MEVDYYSKYLKYKSKYLELKAQIGGDDYYKCYVNCKESPVYCNANRESNFFSYFCSTCRHFHPRNKEGNILDCNKMITDDNGKDKKCKCKSKEYVRSTTCGYCGKIRDLHWYWK
jgi:hypothetical protein